MEVIEVVLVFLLLTLNIFLTLVFLLLTLNMLMLAGYAHENELLGISDIFCAICSIIIFT